MNARLPHMQANLIRALANPGRLMILQQLLAGEKTASDLVRLCGLSKANLSQHIKLLKQEGLVLCTKRGTFCHYAIADPRIVQALGLLSDVLRDRLQAAEQDSQSV
jgi:DNA-binding transcriptional ArsR family regulator